MAATLLSACTVLPPSGPSILVLPGSGKTFEQFRSEDDYCRQYALSQIGGAAPGQVSADSGIASAVTGTAIGAAAGAAFGGGEGAAIGAGGGLLAGSMMGLDASRMSAYETQKRYDMSYIQCMYANGNRVPISGQIVDRDLGGRTDSNEPYKMPLPPPSGLPPTAR
ncbi:MAG: hypothetical protein ACU841_06800 [Gammaproteobacteria bacterium]